MNGPADQETLRVGIVGCGSIARSHALSYQNNPRVELVGVVALELVRADAFAAAYGTTAYDSDLSASRLITMAEQLEQAASLELQGLLA